MDEQFKQRIERTLVEGGMRPGDRFAFYVSEAIQVDGQFMPVLVVEDEPGYRTATRS